MQQVFTPHDHHGCVHALIAEAEAISKAEGLRFTPVRRRVLEILAETHKAVGAYAILERLAAEGLGAQPPIAYRALDFLVAHGLAHKVERLNAYIACTHLGEEHSPVFMICRNCNHVAELDLGEGAGLSQTAAAQGFALERAVVEMVGLCPSCQAEIAV